MTQDHFLLYDVLAYPQPQPSLWFAWWAPKNPHYAPSPEASRNERSPLMQEYVAYINAYGRLYKSIPFVKAIYLANSITFNALKDQSDIDICIVVKHGRMRTARLRTLFLFTLFRIKRNGTNVRKKFCLSFYLDEHELNLQRIALQPQDPYLVYWIAHLVVLYQDTPADPVAIWHHNDWIVHYLPNFPEKQSIFLPTREWQGRTMRKRICERRWGGRLGDIFESLIKLIRLPILLWKKRRLGVAGDDIILSDVMLKFHADKRKKYGTKWKLAQAQD